MVLYALPPEGIIIVTPRILFPPEQHLKQPEAQKLLTGWFDIATKVDKVYDLVSLDFITETLPKSEFRRFTLSKEENSKQDEIGGKYTALYSKDNEPFRVLLKPLRIPYMRCCKPSGHLEGSPAKVLIYFDLNPDDFYFNDHFQINGVRADITSGNEKFEVLATFYQSARFRIDGNKKVATNVKDIGFRLPLFWSKVKGGKL